MSKRPKGNNHIRELKNEIRNTYRAKRRSLTCEQKEALDAGIVRQIRTLASFRFSEIILAFYPLADEIDIRPLLEEALASGKKVAFPRSYDNGIMEFYFVSSLSELAPGRFGIMEPPETGEKFDKSTSAPSLMLVPALVYDRLGYRLGYGKGFYDRYASNFKGVKAGLCYQSCILRSALLPRGRFDLAVDYIVTEKGVRLIEKV